MKTTILRVRIAKVSAGVLGSAFAAGFLAAVPPTAPDAPTTPVQVLVSVSNRAAGAPLTSDNVLVVENNKRRPVTGFKAVADSGQDVDLAILIDGSLGSSLALQFKDVESFLRSLPASTAVGVAYAENGAAHFKQPFSTDRDAAGAALHLTFGKVDTGGSIFQSVSDLARHWPADGRLRCVLLISDGINLNRGNTEAQPDQDPDLDQALTDSTRSGLTIYAIFATGSSRITHGEWMINNGQGSLARLTDDTGGQAYFEGDHTPVSFAPFLDKFRQALANQYVVTFDALAPKKPSVVPLRVFTELPHMHIDGPKHVQVPAAGQ